MRKLILLFIVLVGSLTLASPVFASPTMTQVGSMSNHLQLGYGSDGYIYYQTDIALDSNDYYHVDLIRQDGTSVYNTSEWGSAAYIWVYTGVKGSYNSTFTMQATVYDGYTDSYVSSWGTASLKVLPPVPIVTSLTATGDSALLSVGSPVSVIAHYSDGSFKDISSLVVLSGSSVNPVVTSGNTVSVLSSYSVNVSVNYTDSTYNPNKVSTSLVLNYISGTGGVGKVTEQQANMMIGLLNWLCSAVFWIFVLACGLLALYVCFRVVRWFLPRRGF